MGSQRVGHNWATELKNGLGTSLVVQWLGLCAFTAEGPGLIPGWGDKILQAVWYGQKSGGWWGLSMHRLLNLSPEMFGLIMPSFFLENLTVPSIDIFYYSKALPSSLHFYCWFDVLECQPKSKVNGRCKDWVVSVETSCRSPPFLISAIVRETSNFSLWGLPIWVTHGRGYS